MTAAQNSFVAPIAGFESLVLPAVDIWVNAVASAATASTVAPVSTTPGVVNLSPQQ